MTTRIRATDAVIAIAVTAVLWLRVAAPFEADASPNNWRAWLITGLLGAVLLVRRRWPLPVLAASVVLLLTYYMFNFGAIGAVWPLAVALYTVAEQGRWPWGAVTGTAVLLGSAVFRLTVEQETLNTGSVADVANEAAVLAAVLLAGAMVRNHRRLQVAAREREAAVKAEAAAQQDVQLTNQRLAIARDVHDLVAHSLAGIGVQARLAAELLDEEPDHARTVVGEIGSVTRDALADLRRTVGDLRGSPTPDGLEELVERTAGITVRLDRSTPPRERDDQVETVLVAVVREALTNVVRHARADSTEVVVDDGPDTTTVRIRDDGVGGPIVEGHGLTGMRERLAAVGGHLAVTDSPTGGLEVAATLPRPLATGAATPPGDQP